MHAHGIEVLDGADDHGVVVLVAHQLHFQLFPAQDRLLQQNFVRHAGGQAIGNDGFKVGAPKVEGAKVTATVLKNGKGKKIYVMTYKPKKNEKKKNGHRQPYTKVQIDKIEG